MRINKNYEAELSLKDLFFHILYQWRIILLAGLIAGGVLGFMEYRNFDQYHRAGEKAPAEIQYEAELAKHQETISWVEKEIAAYDELIRDKTNYRETSVLMRMDPTNIWTAEKKYYLNLDGSETDHSYLTMTELSEAFFQDIPAETLIEVFGTADRNDINEIASIALNRGLRTVSVIGCGSTEEEAVRRKEFVDTYLHTAEQRMKESKVFSLDLLSDNVGTKTVLTGSNINGDIAEKDLAAMQAAVSDNILYYQSQKNASVLTRNDLINKAPKKPGSQLVGKALFGFALGAFSVIAVCILFYLLNGKLKTVREMKNRYDLCLLGEYTHSRAWWKGKGLDWVLERLEFGKKKTNPETELENIATLIDAGKDGNHIVLTGTLEEKELRKVYDGLSTRLQKKGISLELQPEYLHNSDAVTASGKAEAVLLVEEKYKSRIKDMNRMAEMLTIENAKVIGAVLI